MKRSNAPANPVPPEKARIITANKIYCQACEENGVQVCSWEQFPAWQEFYEGKISDSQLAERAESDLRHLSHAFDKYTVAKEDDAKGSKEESTKRERAKQANKIYKKACTDSGLSHCFFQNFSTWRDYVHGKIDEPEFFDRAIDEVKKMVSEGA